MLLYSGNNCVMVSQSGYIGIWSGARDQESTNLSARFVEWNFTYVTISNDTSLRYYGDLNACWVSYLRHKSAVKKIICVVVVSCSVNFWASEKDDSLKGGVWVETDNPFAYFFLLLFCFCSLFPTNPRVDTERRKSNKRISGGTDPSKYQVMYVNYPTHLKWTAIVVLTKFLFYRETTTLK